MNSAGFVQGSGQSTDKRQEATTTATNTMSLKTKVMEKYQKMNKLDKLLRMS